MSCFNKYASQVYQRCQQLAEFSQDPSCMDRRYLTQQHREANQQVAKWMKQAGMLTWQDEAGNQWGALASDVPDAPTLVIGSHLDTVPNGGKYDGILGVLLPISLVDYLRDHQLSLPFNLHIVGFGDEEGTRFGATLLGSRAVAGTWQENWATLKDADGTCLAQAMREFGLDINKIRHCERDGKIDAFVEVHIEQGPVLEALNLPIGIVSGIAGARRFRCQVKGLAGHAGTVPMAMRQDALAAAAEMIVKVEALALQHQLVATVGKLICHSGATNVISGNCEFSMDIRSENNAQRDQTFADIQQAIEAIAARRKVSLTVEQTHHADAVLCDPQLQQLLQQAIKDCEISPYTLTSGAGHDSMAMANICPVAMLFMRCDKGISHHPAEAIDSADVAVSLRVLLEFLQLYGQQAARKAA